MAQPKHASMWPFLAFLLQSIVTTGSPLRCNTTYLPERLLALEEHALFPPLNASSPFYQQALANLPGGLSTLYDVGAGRLADMDAGHVSMQILSQLPGTGATNPSGCRKANNALATAIANHPDRYSGFAVLPMAFPDLAAQELERAVLDLGLVGAMIDNHLPNGSYYDNTSFWSVFQTAQRLDVPIYIHPAPPTQTQMELRFVGNYPASVAFRLAASGYGWHEDVGLHILRLYSAGLFQTYPDLKIVIGHDGEGLPLLLNRVEDNSIRNDTTLNEVWNKNIWVTISGFFHLENFKQLLEVTKRDRVMYAVDYPLASNAAGWAFMKELAASGLLSDEEMEMFAFQTAEKLLQLKHV